MREGQRGSEKVVMVMVVRGDRRSAWWICKKLCSGMCFGVWVKREGRKRRGSVLDSEGDI